MVEVGSCDELVIGVVRVGREWKKSDPLFGRWMAGMIRSGVRQ